MFQQQVHLSVVGLFVQINHLVHLQFMFQIWNPTKLPYWFIWTQLLDVLRFEV